MAPPKEYLQAAVSTGDNVKIARAFNDMVYAGWPPDQVIAALKDFLDNSNPFVRYLAGQYLFVVGDQSGYDALLALVQSNTPINGIGPDVRIQAAETLAQFRKQVPPKPFPICISRQKVETLSLHWLSSVHRRQRR